MALIRKTCLGCDKSFQTVSKTARFCSNACVGIGKTKGIVGSRKRRGKTVVCEVCGKEFYRKPYHIKTGRSRFCSEECRKVGWATELVKPDRASRREKLRKGKTIACMNCGTTAYVKKSFLARNVGKTCGNPVCVSAYSRSLWGLKPHADEIARLPKPKRKDIARRGNNFTAKQRAEWLDTKCAWCRSTDNLALDHMIPVCAGGKAIWDNSQTLCQPCNNWKCEHVDRPMALKQPPSGG